MAVSLGVDQVTLLPCQTVAGLRAHLDATETTESELLDLRLLADKRQIEDDGWETLFSF